MQFIKGASSKWIHDTYPTHEDFSWQQGYGAFSIGVSGKQDTIDYINRQQEHHKQVSFEQEYLRFLQRHGIEYDQRYVYG